jgi:hypothetical protein
MGEVHLDGAFENDLVLRQSPVAWPGMTEDDVPVDGLAAPTAKATDNAISTVTPDRQRRDTCWDSYEDSSAVVGACLDTHWARGVPHY